MTMIRRPYPGGAAFIGLLLFLLCVMPGEAATAESVPAEQTLEVVGSAVAVRGEVTATTGKGASRRLAIKDDIFLADTIETGKSGQIQIMFRDNTIISLGRKSALKVAEYEWKPADGTGKMKTQVKEGVFRVMGGIMAKESPENFNTETPGATIGIRGSMYAGQVHGQNLAVVFEGGKGIDLKNATGAVPITKPGYGLKVQGLKDTLQAASRFSAADIGTMQQDFSFQRSNIPGRGETFQAPLHFTPQDSSRLLPGLKTPAPSGPGPDGGAAPGQGGGEAQPPAPESRNLTPEQQQLRTQVLNDPAAALALMKKAVSGSSMSAETALGAVLQGMKNPDNKTLNDLFNQAIDLGLTKDGAKEIVKQLQESGGGCR